MSLLLPIFHATSVLDVPDLLLGDAAEFYTIVLESTSDGGILS